MSDTENSLSDAFLIGKKINRARKSLGLTLEQLAQHLDLSIAAIKKLERGEATIQFAKLARLARTLNTTPNELLGFPNSVAVDRLRAVLKSLFVVLNIPRQDAETLLDQIEEILTKNDVQAPDIDEAIVLQVLAEAKFRAMTCGPAIRPSFARSPTIDCE